MKRRVLGASFPLDGRICPIGIRTAGAARRPIQASNGTAGAPGHAASCGIVTDGVRTGRFRRLGRPRGFRKRPFRRSGVPVRRCAVRFRDPSVCFRIGGPWQARRAVRVGGQGVRLSSAAVALVAIPIRLHRRGCRRAPPSGPSRRMAGHLPAVAVRPASPTVRPRCAATHFRGGQAPLPLETYGSRVDTHGSRGQILPLGTDHQWRAASTSARRRRTNLPRL